MIKRKITEEDQPKDLTQMDQSADGSQGTPPAEEKPPAGAPTKTEKLQTSSEEILLASGKTISKEDGKQLVIKALSNIQTQLQNGTATDDSEENVEEEPEEVSTEGETPAESPEEAETEEKVLTAEPPPAAESRVQNITGLKKALFEGEISLGKPSLTEDDYAKLIRIGRNEPCFGIKKVVKAIRESKVHPLCASFLENVDFVIAAAFSTVKKAVAIAESMGESSIFSPEEIGFAVAQIRNKKTSGNFLLEKKDRKSLAKMLVEDDMVNELPVVNQTAVDVAQGAETVLAAEQLANTQVGISYEVERSPLKDALIADSEFNRAVINGNNQAATARAKELFPNSNEAELSGVISQISFAPTAYQASPEAVEAKIGIQPPATVQEAAGDVKLTGTFNAKIEFEPPDDTKDDDDEKEVEVSDDKDSPSEVVTDYDEEEPEDDEDEDEIEESEGYLRKVGAICEVLTSKGKVGVRKPNVAILPRGYSLDSSLRKMAMGESVKKIARRRLYSRVKAIPAKYIKERKMAEAGFLLVYLNETVNDKFSSLPGYGDLATKTINLNSLSEKERIEVMNLCEDCKVYAVPSRSAIRIDKSRSICEQEEVENAAEENAIATAYADGVNILKTAQNALVDFQGILGKVSALMSVNGSKKTDINKANKLTDTSKEILEMVKDVLKNFTDQQEAFKKEYPDAQEKTADTTSSPDASLDAAPSEPSPSEQPAELTPDVGKDLSTLGTDTKVESVAKTVVRKYGRTLASDVAKMQKASLNEGRLAGLSSREIGEVSLHVKELLS